MIIMGELINGMYKEVGKAIGSKDKKVIQKIAQDQVAAGQPRHIKGVVRPG